LVVLVIITIYIGRNDGYTRTYYIQLLLPPLALIAFIRPIFTRESLNIVVSILLVFWLNFLLGQHSNRFQNTTCLTLLEEKKNFETIEVLEKLTQTTQKKVIVLSPLLTQIHIQNNLLLGSNVIPFNRGGLGGGLNIPRGQRLEVIPFNNLRRELNRRNERLFLFDSIY
jgi:hypothetical protein